jgi:predicted amidohydrolase YtcJ
MLAACSGANEPDTSQSTALPGPDLIFVGDNIITMDGADVTAIAVTGDTISAAGNQSEILASKGANTRIIELGERALLPGLIDAHGHVAIQARLIHYVNLSSPPVGPAKTIADIQDLLRAHIAEKQIAPGEWVIGYGYDESLLAEKRHPTRHDLDAVTTDHQVLLIHVSAHLAALNSAGLAAQNITSDTPNPPGGVIRRETDGKTPNGVLEEAAAQPLMIRLLMANRDGFGENVRASLYQYARYGITTAQDGGAAPMDIADIYVEAAKNPLPIDLVAYAHIGLMGSEQRQSFTAESYAGGFRVGGVKFILDGSIQGKTGYLSQPYLIPPDGQDANYRGYPMMKPETFNALVKPMLARGVPILAHANGDAAIDEMLDGVELALKGTDIRDHRAVMIHAQMMREDQLDRTKASGVLPSYYSAHPYFWGDWHRQILGEERAARISPIRSTIDRGIPFTIHNDTPIVPPDMMRLLWITVNRETRSGFVLGPEQKASVMEALHAMTLGAAFQYFEEDRKGSLTVGKQADLVILSQNPVTADPNVLKDIQIIETIAHGKTVYRAGDEN